MQLRPGSISRGVIIHSCPHNLCGNFLGALTGCGYGVRQRKVGFLRPEPIQQAETSSLGTGFAVKSFEDACLQMFSHCTCA